jgi:AAT family amino acid transporter
MDYIVKRRFDSKLTTGIVGVILCFVYAMLYWPIWATVAKAIISFTAAAGLQAVEPALAKKFIAAFTEGTFFWCSICAWIWQTLIFGNYGKYSLTKKQPGAGIWYTFLSFVCGIGAYLVLISFIGIWWKPFNLMLMFAPHTAQELQLALEGWEASNFYVLPVIIAQIPFVSLFQKKPWTGNLKPPLDGLAVMMTSSLFALLVWVALFVPSFMHLQLGGHDITAQPMGSWPAVLAFCQGFIFWFLIPAEGGEGYPYKLFTSKQPWMGMIGLLLALLCGGYVTPALYVSLINTFNINPGVNPFVTAASLELSLIVTMLCWHHLFDDYPSAKKEPSVLRRVSIRAIIWLVLGTAFGFAWLKLYKILPFAGNDLGMDFPVMGILAGQFALLMVFLYFNTIFDKWPLVYKERTLKQTLFPVN